MSEVELTPDGERALAEAQNFCWRSNVAIVAPEHVLGGALLVLGNAGAPGLPTVDTIREALLAVQGVGETQLQSNVMFGSSAREAINFVARAVREAGGSDIGALELALGTIASDEVNPMFYASLGVPKTELVAALEGGAGDRPGHQTRS